MSEIDKARVHAALEQRLNDRLAALLQSQQAAQSGANHEETRQEDPKDTRAIEARYLARGLAERAEELQLAVALVNRLEVRTLSPEEPIGLSALCAVEDEEGRQAVYFLAPVGAGEKLDVGGQRVTVVTPKSPLGRALVGKNVGDDFELNLPGGKTESTVLWVR